MIKNGNFQWFSAKFRFSRNCLRIHRKKLVGLKKKILEKIGPRRILWANFWNFFQKKSKFFPNFFFLKVVHSTLKRRQKFFFLKKNHGSDFGQNFNFYFGRGIVFFQNFSNFFNFFSLFMYQRTVLEPGQSDSATSPHYERA